MDNTYLLERFNMCATSLNQRLSRAIIKIPDYIKTQAQEIHIRVNKPIAIYCGSITYYLTMQHQLVSHCLPNNMLMATQRDVNESFHNLCSFSVYSRQEEIKNGYLTICGGHRAGICGTAVYTGNEISNVRDISSINLRISKEVKGIAKKILKSIHIEKGGLLLCGVPACGKTTFLRDLSRILSTEENYKVCIIDERGEIGGTHYGVAQNDVGMCDVLDGYKKADGIIHAVRCMSPQIIVCDEIGSNDESESIKACLNSGVSVIASIHCTSVRELLTKPQSKAMLSTGAFEYITFMSDRKHPGIIKEIYTLEELKAYETDRLHTLDSKHNSNRLLSVAGTSTQNDVV